MSLLVGGLLAGAGILVVLHMARPRFRRQRLSAARFFTDLPPADDSRRRFQLGSPLRSRPLYPQLLILGLLAGALLSTQGCEQELEQRLGIWVLVDTSYSMTTDQGGDQGGRSRLDAARDEIRRFLDQAEDVDSGPPCFSFSTFDLEVQPAWPEAIERGGFEQRLADLQARPLGTDLGLLREVVTSAGAEDSQAICPAQVRLVVSDLPAPDWAGEPRSGWIWRDIASPVDNVGLVSAQAVRDPFGGRIDAVVVEVAFYGKAPADVELKVRDASDVVLLTEKIEWPAAGPWRSEIALPKPGRYRLRLGSGNTDEAGDAYSNDAYRGDDEITIEVPEIDRLRVDWRLPSSEWADRLGWQDVAEPIGNHQDRNYQDRADLDLTVLPIELAAEISSTGPVLILGNQYLKGRAAQISFFEADSVILDGLNFDVAEEARILGVALPTGFEPALVGGHLDRDIWVARRQNPPAVYLPGPPTGGDDTLGRFSTTLFVQSLRWLLAGTPPSPLYTLTSPAHPQPEGTRVALHEGEGKTDHLPLSRGNVEDLEASVRRPVESPSWPWWLAAAAGVFLVEQTLLAFAGDIWR